MKEVIKEIRNQSIKTLIFKFDKRRTIIIKIKFKLVIN